MPWPKTGAPDAKNGNRKHKHGHAQLATTSDTHAETSSMSTAMGHRAPLASTRNMSTAMGREAPLASTRVYAYVCTCSAPAPWEPGPRQTLNLHDKQTLNLHNSALIRPLEELLHYKCSTLRGELDSPTPRVFRGFWSQVCLG